MCCCPMAPMSITRWMTKHCSVHDECAVCLRLSRQGHALALHVAERVCHVEATLTEFSYHGCMRNAVPTPPQMLYRVNTAGAGGAGTSSFSTSVPIWFVVN